MSKARDEYLEYEITNGLNPKIHNYVCELEERISHLIDSNIARDLVIKANEKQIIELIGTLSMALDQNKRRLYLNEIKETLNKYK